LRHREVSEDEKNDNCKNASMWFHGTYRAGSLVEIKNAVGTQ
jgi:hypothetical protein